LELSSSRRSWESIQSQLHDEASAARQAHAAEVAQLKAECDALKRRLEEALAMHATAKSAFESADAARLANESRISRLLAGALLSPL
jgi:hypothetical protein